jgi:hypothetical protein
MGITYGSAYLTDLGTPSYREAAKRNYQSLKTGYHHICQTEYDELSSQNSDMLIWEGAINTPIIIDDEFWIVIKETYSKSIEKNYLVIERVVPEEDFKGPTKKVIPEWTLPGSESRGWTVRCSSQNQENWVMTGHRKLVTSEDESSYDDYAWE